MRNRLRKITANADWYVPITFEIKRIMKANEYSDNTVSSSGALASELVNFVETQVHNHINELCDELNVSEEELLSPQYIDKIAKGFAVYDCQSQIDELIKEMCWENISGNASSLDWSSWDNFWKSYKRDYSKLVKIINKYHRKQREMIEEEYPEFKAYAKELVQKAFDNPTYGNILTLAGCKDEAKRLEYYDLYIELKKSLNKAIELKCEREVDNYSLNDIENFESGYYAHLSEHIQEMLNIRREELLNNEKQEEDKVEPNNRLSENAKIANQKIFAGFGVGSEGEMYFVKGFPDADTRARIKAEGGRFSGVLKKWYFNHKATGFGSLYLAYAQDLFYPFEGRFGKQSLKINMNDPRSEEVSELIDNTRFDDEKLAQINNKIKNSNFSIGDTISVKAECIKKYNYRGSSYVFNFVDDDDNHFVAFSQGRFKFCKSVEQGDIITLGGTIKSSQVNSYTNEFEYVLDKPTAK